MYPTDEQARTLEQLTREYGQPDAVFHEVTNEPYGLIRAEWPLPSTLLVDAAGNPVKAYDENGIEVPCPPRERSRMLYVRPDGTRCAWRMVHP